ncbi:interleukin-1 receptor antagonist protein-like isoform X2 [Lissotriton helveticus]
MVCTCETKPPLPDANWGLYSKTCTRCGGSCQVNPTIPKQPLVFRRMVVIVVAVKKMKRGVTAKCLFGDRDLLEMLKNMLVDEDIPYQTCEDTSMAQSDYRFSSCTQYRITDTANKTMLLQEFSDQAQLVAVYLQGPNTSRQVKLNMTSYKSLPPPSNRKLPVTLGIVGKKLHLSCMMVGGQPELRLEEVNSTLINIKSNLLHFLFFKADLTGSGTSCTFESAACPRWYISTSQNANDQVTVRSQADQRAIQNFKLFKE